MCTKLNIWKLNKFVIMVVLFPENEKFDFIITDIP